MYVPSSRTLGKLVALSALAAAPSLAIEPCATGVHFITARGEGLGDDLQRLKSIRDLVLANIPGSTSLALPYHHDWTDKNLAAHNGAQMLQEYITDYANRCPRSKVAIHGWSLGAVLMMDALCGTSSVGLHPVLSIDPSYNKTVIAAIMYGDETYYPLMPWDIGTCNLGFGLFPRQNPASCLPFRDSLRSYCDEGDFQCCYTDPPPGLANLPHHEYFDKYNEDVVRFIQKRLDEVP